MAAPVRYGSQQAAKDGPPQGQVDGFGMARCFNQFPAIIADKLCGAVPVLLLGRLITDAKALGELGKPPVERP